jgi:hypothetical protein
LAPTGVDGEVDAGEPHPAGARHEDAGAAAKGGGLAGAVRADQAEDLAGGGGERHPAQGEVAVVRLRS